MFVQAMRQSQTSALKKKSPYLNYLGQSTTVCHLKEEKYVSQLELTLQGNVLNIHESFQTG